MISIQNLVSLERKTYTPLTALSEIRLLCLEPGKRGQSISYSLVNASLDQETPEYEALSYKWEQDPPGSSQMSLVLTSANSFATTNLERALQYLRHESETRLLWVDALCINQNDLDEKMSQVMLMRRIYQSAKRVVVWLGEPDFDTHLAMDLLARVSNREGFETLPSAHEMADAWAAMHRIWKRPYWRRIWVVQEVVVAKDVVIGCGDTWLPLECYFNALRFPALYPSNSIVKGDQMWSWSMNMTQIRSDYQLEGPQDIQTLLYTTHSFQSTVMQDKIFALLGLTDVETQAAIKPDYRKPLTQICSELIEFTVQRGHNLKIISGDRPQSLASWIPKFLEPSGQDIDWTLFDDHFHASGNIPPQINFSEDHNTLSVRGFEFDTIKIVFDPIKQTDDVLYGRSSLLRAIEAEVLATFTSNQGGQSGSSEPINPTAIAAEPIWRTLVANHSVPKNRIPQLENRSYPASMEIGKGYEILLGRTAISNELWSQATADFLWNLEFSLLGRCFFITKGGSVGLGPKGTMGGDKVCILYGGQLPFLLRGDDDNTVLVGDAYVHGVMDGEAIEYLTKGTIEERVFNLK